jgi:hypothetical protein
MTKKNINLNNFKFFLDMLIFFGSLVFICIIFAINLRGTISEGLGVVTWEEKSIKFCRSYTENLAYENQLLIIICVALWVRVLNFTRYNEYLGKFLGVVKRLISEIVLFFILYLVNLIVFAAIAESCFTDLKDYKDFPQAFVTLFYASYGDFSFSEFEACLDRVPQPQGCRKGYYDTKFGENFGIIFMILFLVINIGLFMSLFVSIITVLF